MVILSESVVEGEGLSSNPFPYFLRDTLLLTRPVRTEGPTTRETNQDKTII